MVSRNECALEVLNSEMPRVQQAFREDFADGFKRLDGTLVCISCRKTQVFEATLGHPLEDVHQNTRPEAASQELLVKRTSRANKTKTR